MKTRRFSIPALRDYPDLQRRMEHELRSTKNSCCNKSAITQKYIALAKQKSLENRRFMGDNQL